MKPWRAAETSATASGNRTLIASRSAIACSSAPPWADTCWSAAVVSSTAVFSVRVANCSRWASWTVSACCSANSRRLRIKSSGSPPKGKPGLLPSMTATVTSTSQSSGDLVGGLDVAGQLLDRRRRLLHRNREGRAFAPEDSLERERRRADRVEPLRRRDARSRADRLLERECGLFRLVDSRRILGQAQCDELRAELLQIAATGRLLGELDQRGNRDHFADAHAVLDRLPLLVEHEPARLTGLAAIGAEVGAGARGGLGRDDADDLLAWTGVANRGLGNPPEILGQSHRAENKL